jgi:hypothetical protein
MGLNSGPTTLEIRLTSAPHTTESHSSEISCDVYAMSCEVRNARRSDFQGNNSEC